ncbi:hypothetical protein BX600DRAFT_450398 [Xylariales sp. PMI_506]|nr:hypothetical protein BX600DRAFT_450398 [Xylariales sp. PMI_506]
MAQAAVFCLCMCGRLVLSIQLKKIRGLLTRPKWFGPDAHKAEQRGCRHTLCGRNLSFSNRKYLSFPTDNQPSSVDCCSI